MIHTDQADCGTGTSGCWLQLSHRLLRIATLEDATVSVKVAFATAPSESVLCSAVDSQGRLFAVATDAKVVSVFALDSSEPVASVSCQKRPAFLTFIEATSDQQQQRCLLIADKGGDVMRLAFSVSGAPSGGGCEAELILGHLAMLTAIDVVHCSTGTGRCLATGDADARIRISRLPNAYNIESFCLGHSGPVLGLSGCLDECLVSLSADGSLRTWRARDGAELSQLLLDDGICGPGRIPCHLAVSRKHRVAACIAVAIEDARGGVGAQVERTSVLLLCKIGPYPDCGLTLLGNAGISLGNGRVAACCHDSRTDGLLLLGDSPVQPVEARRIADGSSLEHPLATWAAADEANRSAASEAAQQRLQFFRDVMTYDRLEAVGYKEYLDGKDERMKRLKLKRKRGSAARRTDEADVGSSGDEADEMQLE